VHPGSNEAYVFTNVFRDMITGSISGDPVLPAMTIKSPGRVVVRNYTYKVPENLEPAHCRIIAYVINTTDKKIIHSCQTRMR